MNTSTVTLVTEPLSAASFREFGEVIEPCASAQQLVINEGFATRFHDLVRVDVDAGGGRAGISIFRALPRTLPFQLRLMERHPLGSQAFVSMSDAPFLVVVAPPAEQLDLSQLRCFRAAPGQGVNYARGTWHHPLIALERSSDFLVIDRCDGVGNNLDEVNVLTGGIWLRA